MGEIKCYIISIISLILCITVSMAIIWGGVHKADKDWEHNAENTKCLITNTSIITMEYHTYQPPSSYNVYDGYINVSHTLDDIVYFENIEVVTSYWTLNGVNNVLDKYTIGEEIDCWYNINNPSDIHLGLVSDVGYILSSIILIILFISCHLYMACK